jgi:uncharacterized DUF497 family protein
VHPWDPKKAAKNLAKHKIGFPDALTVVEGDRTMWEPDATYDDRVNAIGFSSKARVLFVVTLEDGWIISARKAENDEEERYAEYLQEHEDS